ncbi:MAG: hypothetical protein ACREFH_16575, partial [Stellaceae bacterium]
PYPCSSSSMSSSLIACAMIRDLLYNIECLTAPTYTKYLTPSADRLRAKLREVKETLRRRLHEPIAEQGAWLGQVVRGFFAYHAVPNNIQALGAFRRHVGRLWGRALRRRSQKDATPWRAVTKLADQWLPKPHIIHPWSDRRFAAKHPRWEPGAGIPHAGFCAGGAP